MSCNNQLKSARLDFSNLNQTFLTLIAIKNKKLLELESSNKKLTSTLEKTVQENKRLNEDKIKLDQNIKNQRNGLGIDQLHNKGDTSEGNSTKQINSVDNLNVDNNRLNVNNLIVPATECTTTELQNTINKKNEYIAKLEFKIKNQEDNKTSNQETNTNQDLQITINEKNQYIAELESKIKNLESNKTPSQETKIKNQEENKTSNQETNTIKEENKTSNKKTNTIQELQKTINEKNEHIAKLESNIKNLESNKTPSQETKINNQEENKTSNQETNTAPDFNKLNENNLIVPATECTTTELQNTINKKDEYIAKLESKIKNQESCVTELSQKQSEIRELQKQIEDKGTEINNVNSQNEILKAENLSQKIRLADASNGGINGKIVHLNNLFAQKQDFKSALEIDVQNFTNQFDTRDKRLQYLTTLYKWSSLVMLNTINTRTISSVYEEFADATKYKAESFINAIFLFTMSFQIGLMDNVLY